MLQVLVCKIGTMEEATEETYRPAEAQFVILSKEKVENKTS